MAKELQEIEDRLTDIERVIYEKRTYINGNHHELEKEN